MRNLPSFTRKDEEFLENIRHCTQPNPVNIIRSKISTILHKNSLIILGTNSDATGHRHYKTEE
ncbi:hypothetical protein T4D_6574 [Trichinella pseudospiralis]|uniref:Uncharacterized protein n=1 Tax=Trichinella pseudospiralis TaxID=6337 RepID=A0A0V1G3P3_TRIPS|nr:hypothetical protein T4D_6574 [Trichinella pseudospiralis]